MHRHHPTTGTPPLTTTTRKTTSNTHNKYGKKRGNYACRRCGQPKKGHICHIGNTANTPIVTIDESSSSSIIASTPSPDLPRHLRRALSFDDLENEDNRSVAVSDDDDDEDLENLGELGEGKLPMSCLWEVFKRLPPTGLLSAAKVCKGWRDCTKKLWKAAEELKLVVPAKAQVGFVGSVLQKCSKLVRLSLKMGSELDATMMACIAFACPNLEVLEIQMLNKAINRITGDELGRFIADKRCLSCLKIEGCSNLGYLNTSSSALSTLWLSGLCSLSKMVFFCPNLNEISFDFSRQEKDSTDLVALMDGLGRGCARLQNIHISSVRLSHDAVLSLTDANFRGLRKLSLVLGSEITDASVAAIASSYPYLELLDLSGSSISDGGLGIICNELTEPLSRLLLALCPNITSSGIQFAAAQLPNLELMDCGMTICDPNSQNAIERNGSQRKLHLIYQKLIIKHLRLKKLSLWGCSGLDALYLNCPELNDLNLTSCANLHPESLQLQCPSLESVHASGCQDMLVKAIQGQVTVFATRFPPLKVFCGSQDI
ncbi:hypothetical protein GIB67_027135 [Kingdonia uniflora]|uniref:F-box domain-containing protein n=1 Tax=Kingdonia uniflora TaxID=39325 RepID=A0A7J7P283_9MAGN|nr:hypothetical protein GIB67_027135 [Kingdonia uniflora]